MRKGRSVTTTEDFKVNVGHCHDCGSSMTHKSMPLKRFVSLDILAAAPYFIIRPSHWLTIRCELRQTSTASGRIASMARSLAEYKGSLFYQYERYHHSLSIN